MLSLDSISLSCSHSICLSASLTSAQPQRTVWIGLMKMWKLKLILCLRALCSWVGGCMPVSPVSISYVRFKKHRTRSCSLFQVIWSMYVFIKVQAHTSSFKTKTMSPLFPLHACSFSGLTEARASPSMQARKWGVGTFSFCKQPFFHILISFF